jgi:hypothetical protein
MVDVYGIFVLCVFVIPFLLYSLLLIDENTAIGFADFTVTLRIADQSRTTGISVTFFANNTALLPRVKSSGDVISLHNVVV